MSDATNSAGSPGGGSTKSSNSANMVRPDLVPPAGDERPSRISPGRMSRDAPKKRQLAVTEEPFVLGDSVKGRPLSTVRRRAAAILFDFVLCFVVATPVILALSFGALYLQTPTLAKNLSAVFSGGRTDEIDRGMAELLLLVSKRQPSAVPHAFAEALAAGDLDAVEALLATETLNLNADLGKAEPSYYHPYEKRLYLRGDVLFGRLRGALGYLGFGLLYFTLATWIGKGRTPGKWLFGLRVLRLDGAPLRLWDSFGRAGGYAGSFSTVGLGFVEALWDPNRQALHDKVASTVVVRDPRGSLLPRRTARRLWRAARRQRAPFFRR